MEEGRLTQVRGGREESLLLVAPLHLLDEWKIGYMTGMNTV